MATTEKMINLLTKDGVIVPAKYQIMINMSVLIKELTTDLGVTDEPIPVAEVESKYMGDIIKFCEYHNDTPLKYNENGKFTTELSEWDNTFVKDRTDDNKFEMLNMAMFMQIKQLTQVMAKSIAMDMQKCSTTEELRERYHIVNDFTDAEEIEVQKEVAWCDPGYKTKKERGIKSTEVTTPTASKKKKKHSKKVKKVEETEN